MYPPGFTPCCVIESPKKRIFFFFSPLKDNKNIQAKNTVRSINLFVIGVKILISECKWTIKLTQFDNNHEKWDKNLENFTLTPIFALHSQNGIGLPVGVTVAQLLLVQFVLVRIQVRQPKKKSTEMLAFFI